MKSLAALGIGACALGLAATSAPAAPAGGLAAAIDRETAQGTLVEHVHYRRHCHWHDGYRHCRHGRRHHHHHHHRYYGYYDDYGYYDRDYDYSYTNYHHNRYYWPRRHGYWHNFGFGHYRWID